MTTTAPARTPPAGPATSDRAAALRQPLAALRQRIRTGELGAWPVIGGLVVICIVFQSLNDRFLTAQNLYFLVLQNAAPAMIAIGIVLVLLLGEYDLSAGSVSGVAGAALAVLTVRNGLPEWLGLLGALALGAAIGAVHGTIVARLGVLSFVVTLAGFVGWQGLQLWLLGDEGTINIPYEGFVGRLTHTDLGPTVGWSLGVAVIMAYGATALTQRRRRIAAGLPVATPVRTSARLAVLGLGVLGCVAVLDAYRGVPVALVVVVGVAVGLDLVLRRTRYGRGIFAVGGNAEAARRAGIRVTRLRISVFALCSTLAAAGGILAASRSYAVGQSSGGGDVLLMAIAAAVIGGTSLFGGRGTTYSALLGMLVLGSIQSGMLLLQLDTEVRYMITAAVLLGAVALDSVSRRGRQAGGTG